MRIVSGGRERVGDGTAPRVRHVDLVPREGVQACVECRPVSRLLRSIPGASARDRVSRGGRTPPGVAIGPVAARSDNEGDDALVVVVAVGVRLRDVLVAVEGDGSPVGRVVDHEPGVVRVLGICGEGAPGSRGGFVDVRPPPEAFSCVASDGFDAGAVFEVEQGVVDERESGHGVVGADAVGDGSGWAHGSLLLRRNV